MEPFLTDWLGKSPLSPGSPAHPAAYHMLDVAAVAELMIAPFQFPSPRRDALVLLTALHDLGKIGTGFRDMLLTGSTQPYGRHWEMTEVLLRKHDAHMETAIRGSRRARPVLYAAIAGHHGRPPRLDNLEDPRLFKALGPQAVQDAAVLIDAFALLWPEADLGDLSLPDAKALSWWLPGLVAVADWIGSNPEWFPPRAPDLGVAEYLALTRKQAETAVALAGLTEPAPSKERLFDFPLRPMQIACSEIELPEGPILAVIEEETGAGKTEAALILAQQMMHKGKGRGLFFALPTTATADALFLRAREIVGRMFEAPPTLTLAHGRASMSAAYRELRAPSNPASDAPLCTDWLADDRRRALLGTVGVGTIDQALLSVLPTRFNTLRHFGLSSKILIVDEVHELGAPYMSEELAQLLRLHRLAGGSAILLTATLPLDQRRALLAAWGAEDEGHPAYPALTIASGPARHDFPQETGARGPVGIIRLPAVEDAVALLVASARQGAASLWVRNAVDDAIAGVNALRAVGVEADLLHARFTLGDRLRHEHSALARFGKKGAARAGRVLVATQVVESSLDLDFDVMVSDLAPIAALIQRAGRLWRHMDLRPVVTRPVPAPVLHVVSPDPAQVEDERWLRRVLDKGAWVYPLDLQWRTAEVLSRIGRIESPSGLRALIEAVHGAEAIPVPPELDEAERQRLGQGYAEVSHARQNMIEIQNGYRFGGGAAEDVDYPTRLGQPMRALRLARWKGSCLVPLAGAGADAWQLSEVQAAERRLGRLDLPDQSAPDIVAVTADWPEWRRAAVTLCPVDQQGHICAGLRYNPEQGLLFEADED